MDPDEQAGVPHTYAGEPQPKIHSTTYPLGIGLAEDFLSEYCSACEICQPSIFSLETLSALLLSDPPYCLENE